jgi:hypothetical protein
VRALAAVKLLHTIAWAVFAGAIVAIPIAAFRSRYDWAAWLSALVAVEVVILAFNGWQCPLTPVAAQYTTDRRPNFDIYLPEWLARYNKEIFGPLYIGGMLFAWARWQGWVG